MRKSNLKRFSGLLFILAVAAIPVSAQDQTNQSPKDKGPSYEDTVKWIQDHIGDAGFPASSKSPGRFGVAFASDDTPYTVKFDGCDMRLSISVRTHTTDTSPVGGKAENDVSGDSTESWSFNVHLARLDGVIGSTQILPSQLGSPTPAAYADQNFPTVVIMFPDNGGGATWSQTTTSTNTSFDPAPPIIDKPLGTWWPVTKTVTQGIVYNAHAIQITYARPGAEDSPQHMIKALKHVIDLCKANPDAGPKDIF
jgi:hypothetical protein